MIRQDLIFCIARDLSTIRDGYAGCQGEAFYLERISKYRSTLKGM